MRLTTHAQQRWTERFPDEDLSLTYARAKQRVGRKTRQAIRAACPAHEGVMRGGFKGIYYQMTPDRIVFVMTPPEVVITVFRLT
jgi:hypothetical protein